MILYLLKEHNSWTFCLESRLDHNNGVHGGGHIMEHRIRRAYKQLFRQIPSQLETRQKSLPKFGKTSEDDPTVAE